MVRDTPCFTWYVFNRVLLAFTHPHSPLRPFPLPSAPSLFPPPLPSPLRPFPLPFAPSLSPPDPSPPSPCTPTTVLYTALRPLYYTLYCTPPAHLTRRSTTTKKMATSRALRDGAWAQTRASSHSLPVLRPLRCPIPTVRTQLRSLCSDKGGYL
jgi:hypothetical protein